MGTAGILGVLSLWLGAVPGGPPLIASPRQAELLCRALGERPSPADLSGEPVDDAAVRRGWQERRDAALARSYAVEVPGRLLRFARYDDETEELVLDDRWALAGAKGGLDVYPATGRWTIAATPEQAHEAYRLWRARKVRLLVAFHPSAEGCHGLPYAASHSLAVEPGFIELASADGSFVLPGGDDWKPVPRDAVPRVRAERPVVASGEVDAHAVEQAIEASAELRGCYQHALENMPEAGGNVVLEAEVASPGVVQTARVALDDTEDPGLATCLRERFQAMTLTGAGAGAHLYVPIELERR